MTEHPNNCSEPNQATMQGGVPPANTASLQLRSEDFEHIWLRVKDRYWARVFYGFLLSASLGALGAYAVATHEMERSVERAVKDYAQTEAFKVRIAQVARDELPDLKTAMAALEQREAELGKSIEARQNMVAALEAGLVKIADGSAILTTGEGRTLHIEYGHSAVNELSNVPIKFGVPFVRAPTIFLTLIDGQPTRSSLPLSATHVSVQGFELSPYRAGFLPSRVDWIAVGQ